MKKLIFTRVLPLCIVLGTILIIGSGCPGGSSSTPAATCDTTNSLFKQLYAAKLTALPGQDLNSMDLQTHEYTFSVSTNKTICAVGYKGHPNITAASVPYNIEISAGGTVLYSGNHIFSSVNTSYVSITPLNITAGTQYKIKRTLNNFLGNIGNTVGRYMGTTAAFSGYLPLTHGGLTIHATNAYGSGGPVPNFGLPFIDIVFQ